MQRKFVLFWYSSKVFEGQITQNLLEELCAARSNTARAKAIELPSENLLKNLKYGIFQLQSRWNVRSTALLSLEMMTIDHESRIIVETKSRLKTS